MTDKQPTRRTALASIAAVPAFAQSSATPKAAHPVVRFEIGCRDRAKTEKFFGDLFGWNMQSAGPATLIEAAERGIAGHITALGHEPFHYTIFYVEVEDAKAYLDKAAALGGKVLVPPIKIPMGTFAWFADPDGNMIGLLQAKA